MKASDQGKSGASSLKSPRELWKATEYSLRGLRAVIVGEKAFRTDLVLFALAAVAAGLLRFYGWVSTCECALMVYVVFMVPIAEIVNTAIETVIDRISTERHELSGRAKDIGSAIVFAALLGAGMVWALILGVAAWHHWGA